METECTGHRKKPGTGLCYPVQKESILWGEDRGRTKEEIPEKDQLNDKPARMTWDQVLRRLTEWKDNGDGEILLHCLDKDMSWQRQNNYQIPDIYCFGITTWTLPKPSLEFSVNGLSGYNGQHLSESGMRWRHGGWTVAASASYCSARCSSALQRFNPERISNLQITSI